ncbi:MAG: hypothetical protein JG782_1348 [Anaerophaga sp.]|nr:hypothetical protein [Anaerophaga sp.]MDK2841863.1 hypothetical protein [Anaerophaga sp.]
MCHLQGKQSPKKRNPDISDEYFGNYHNTVNGTLWEVTNEKSMARVPTIRICINITKHADSSLH